MVESNVNSGLSHLSVEELSAISSRQSQQLRMQRQTVLSKEERLKNLIAQYHRHEQKLDNLKHIRATLQAQESRLRDLKGLKQQTDQQAVVNMELGDELEKSKSVFATREKELAEAVAKVDILTAQLDRNRSSSKPASSVVNNNAGSDTVHTTFIAAEIDRLKQEQRYRSHLVQQQKRKIDSKDASLVQKTLERNQLDVRINEIAERLNKRKVQILTATQPPSNGQKHQGQNAVGAGAVAAGGNANVGGGGGRPPLAQPVGARDPAKVATIEPYNQRLPYENRENSSDVYANKDPHPRYNDQSNHKVSLNPSGHPESTQKTANTTPLPPAPTDNNAQPQQNGHPKNHRHHESSDRGTTRDKSQQRIELILRETSNLPSIVTDTLLRDNSDYLRVTGTPDTCSSSSDTTTPSVTVSASDPTPPKTHRNAAAGGGHSLPGHHHGRASKDTASSSGSSQVPQGKSGRRVKFDPQALLLDASLEGELELVVKTVQQVMDPSSSNDEGITALHNAICAGHFAIVKFLVEYGCDVNAQDTDGWSPLHCAASCNNLSMCRFLIEHGACVYSTTHSDHETAAQKCEEDEADFEGCSQYLLETLHQLGRINDGIVFAVYDYQAQNSDELSFQCGDKMRILRLSDDDETEWYWAERLPSSESSSGKTVAPTCGYIPRNLLALYPRVRRTQRAK